MSSYYRHKQQKGAVSIFLVIFFAILITIITISFIRMALRDQGQATSSDLSRSAYDSALAGVEDAKRAIAEYKRVCASGDTTNCARYRTAFGEECNGLVTSGVVTQRNDPNGNQEVMVSESESLNQAYTCVNVNLTPADYLGEVSPGGVTMIPLKGVAAFSSVEISWTTREDIGEGVAIDLQTLSGVSQLPQEADWPSNRPAMLRTQFLRYDNGSITASQFDDGRHNMTGFLHPSSVGLSTSSDAAFANRRSPSIAPQPVRCEDISRTDKAYACTMTITLAEAVETDDSFYLALSSIYNSAHYRIALKNGNQTVLMNEVQPEVDATGRADVLFRRVLARVETASSFPYPENAVDLTGNLCKNFRVTSDPNDYRSTCTATP